MNAPAAVRETVRRAARFNLWAAVAVIALFGVFAVKAAMDNHQVPSRHFEQRSWYETTLDRVPTHKVEKP